MAFAKARKLYPAGHARPAKQLAVWLETTKAILSAFHLSVVVLEDAERDLTDRILAVEDERAVARGAELARSLQAQREALQGLRERQASLEALQAEAMGKSNEGITAWIEQQGLKQAKPRGYYKRVFNSQVFYRDAARNRYGKGIHGQGYGNTENSQYMHRIREEESCLEITV